MSGTTLVCSVVAGLGVAYAVEEARRLRSGRLFELVGRGQALRRIVGSLLVAVLMVLVFVGLEVVDARSRPRGWITVWGAASMLVVLLFALGILDWRELRANRDIKRARDLLRMGRDEGLWGQAPRDPKDGPSRD